MVRQTLALEAHFDDEHQDNLARTAAAQRNASLRAERGRRAAQMRQDVTETIEQLVRRDRPQSEAEDLLADLHEHLADEVPEHLFADLPLEHLVARIWCDLNFPDPNKQPATAPATEVTPEAAQVQAVPAETSIEPPPDRPSPPRRPPRHAEAPWSTGPP
jgi:hypothetical protein